MRQGKELYTKKYQEAMEMHKKGMNTKEIAGKLGISFSAVYSWTRKGRTPETGVYEQFFNFLRESGPQPLLEVRKYFPKHSEIFLGARERGFSILRKRISRAMGEYSIWYYLPGQESVVQEMISNVIKKRQELAERISESFDVSRI